MRFTTWGASMALVPAGRAAIVRRAVSGESCLPAEGQRSAQEPGRPEGEVARWSAELSGPKVETA